MSLQTDIIGYVLDIMDLTPQEMLELSRIERFTRKKLSYRLETTRLLLQRENYYLNFLKFSQYKLDMIPREHLTYKICLSAVCKNGWNMEYVPMNQFNQEECNSIREAFHSFFSRLAFPTWYHFPEEDYPWLY